MAATDVTELCEKAGIRNPERFTSLGITTASDVMQIDLVGELPLLEQRGITYMEMKKLKTAAEGQEVAKGPVTVTVPATRMDMMAPPAEFVDKFASLAHGCYCWRVVEQIKADRKTQECVLVVTQEFLLVCSLAGAITTVMRCQDVELVALQEGSPSVLAIKAFPKCCEPTVVVSLLANAKNPVNDPMHPVHSLNFVRKRTVKADINLIKVPTTMHIHNLPVLAGSFEEGENYITPHMKFQILQQTKSWPNGGASSLPNFEFVYKSADGTTNTVRLGKNFGKEFGSTGKFQWYVDGKARMPDIREVRYEAATQELSFRKNDTSLKPGLPAEESARYQCLKSIGALAARARIRCTGLPKDSRRRKKEESYQFTDLAGVTHKLTPNPKGGIEWWMGPSMFQVKALNYNQKTSQLVGGTVGPTALLKDAEVLQRVLDLVTSAGVTCTGFNDTKEASGSYSHNPYPAPGDPDAMSDLPTSPRLSFTGSPRETPTNGLMTSPNPSPAPDADELGMSGLALMQPNDDAMFPPAYQQQQRNSFFMHQGQMPQNNGGSRANSPYYYTSTPTPPPPLCTPIPTPTPPVPTPPPGAMPGMVAGYSTPLSPLTSQQATMYPTHFPQQQQQQQQQQAKAAQPQQQTQVASAQLPMPSPAAQASQPPQSSDAEAASATTAAQPVVRVAVMFKHGRRGEFASAVRVKAGEYVVVETPSGPGLGLVVGERKGGRRDDTFKLVRKATPQEVSAWSDLVGKEQFTLPSLADMAARSQTGMRVHRCEFPMDATRLVVHYSGAEEGAISQVIAQFSTLLGCTVVPNSCLPGAGQLGEPIDEAAPHLPQV